MSLDDNGVQAAEIESSISFMLNLGDDCIRVQLGDSDIDVVHVRCDPGCPLDVEDFGGLWCKGLLVDGEEFVTVLVVLEMFEEG